jgi:predicted MPP superfamily phosphohydrolase
MHSLIPDLRAPASPFDPPHLIYTILTQPLHLLSRLSYHFLTLLRPQPRRHQHPIRVVCISDLHSLDPGKIPNGDVLIHAGDITAHGTPSELQAAIDLLSPLPHKHKYIIAGNHDTYLDPSSRTTLLKADQHHAPLNWKSLTYLQHSSASIYLPSHNRSLHIHGSPQTPLPDPAFAFTYARSQDAWHKTVPPETDILITHSPPKHHLDLPAALGCEHLAAEVSRVKPLLHVFGHVHAGRSDFEGWLKSGRERVVWDAGQDALISGLSRRARGCLWDFWNLCLWWDFGRVVFYGLKAVLWERVWGGRLLEGQTLMVNAAMMFEGSGVLGNAVQVVDI